MAKDPAFLFYDGDAARDVSHMNRLERGCYFDIIQAQKKFGGCTMEQLRKILGKDFDDCWPAIEIVLTKESETGIYFIEWVRKSIEDRKVYSEKNRKRIQDYWDKKKKEDSEEIPRNNHGNSNELPYVNENAIAIEDVIVNENKGGVGEKEKPKSQKVEFAQFVHMTNEEHSKLILEHGPELTKLFIEKLDNYKASSGKKYKDDYRAILSWVVEDVKKRNKVPLMASIAPVSHIERRIKEGEQIKQDLDKIYGDE